MRSRTIRALLRRAVSGFALAAVLLTTSLALTSAPAAAHTKLNPYPTCVGSEVGHHHTHGGKVSVFVSYSSANNGTNCVWAQKQTLRGTSEYMHLYVSLQDTTFVGRDVGNYKYYVGPVSGFGTAGKCLYIDLWYQGYWDTLGPIHCG